MSFVLKKNFKLLFLVYSFFFFPQYSFSSNIDSKIEFRAIWVLRSSLVNKDEIDKILEFAKDNNFNHIFLQVRGRGDAFYNSSFVPKSNLIKPNNFDPLSYALQKSKKLNIKIHLWLNMLLIWSSKTKPKNSFHIYNNHSDWIDKSFLPKEESNINHFKFLSPSHPGVKNHLKNVIKELLLNYDFDGIHYDYIRYSDLDYGYNEVAISIFKKQYKLDEKNFFFDNRISEEYNNNWNDFRRNQLSNLVKDLSFEIRKQKDAIIITAAVKPNVIEAQNRFYQDWSKWIINKSIDYAVPMNYSKKNSVFESNIYGVYNIFPSKIIMGIGVYNQDLNSVLEKINISKKNKFLGVSFFSYDSRKENPNFFSKIKREF